MPVQGVYEFEQIDDTLAYMPLAARRVLDGLGRKLSLDGWLSLRVDDRRRIVAAGTRASVDESALGVLEAARPPAEPIAAELEPDETQPPPKVVAALGTSRPLDVARWRSLRALDRYALAKCAGRPEKLARAYDEIAGVVLSHLGRSGEAHMVDVGHKAETARRAVATAHVTTTRAVVEAIASGSAAKGDVLAAARIAGILASKRTAELVPLCHPVRTTRASVDFELDAARAEIRLRAVVEAVDRTGVEMEAMVAASVASLTVYDMIKSADRWASIGAVRLESKSGGKSGDVTRPAERS
ncbi:MAG TPA: cyclic pyranopterin monophosphate synthase MoaC [Polyangiaceae bacterium]